jgi:hypothetical protein
MLSDLYHRRARAHLPIKFVPVTDFCRADGLLASIIFASAVAPPGKDFAFGEILSFALPKESIQRKCNPIPLEIPLKNADLRRKRNSRFATVESLRHPFS